MNCITQQSYALLVEISLGSLKGVMRGGLLSLKKYNFMGYNLKKNKLVTLKIRLNQFGNIG